MRFAELAVDDPRWEQAFDVLVQLRTHLDRATLARIQTAGAGQGLTFTAALDGEGTCLGVAGWRVMDTTHTVRKLYVDDLVVAAGHRSQGVGEALLTHVEDCGRAAGCHVIELDSGRQRLAAHRFYRRLGFEDASRHFTKPLTR